MQRFNTKLYVLNLIAIDRYLFIKFYEKQFFDINSSNLIKSNSAMDYKYILLYIIP